MEEAPYETIECIFNNRNYWINMDPTRPIVEVNLDFENDTTGEWEFVMINNEDKKDGEEDEIGEDDDEDEDNAGNNEEELLDMPPPWSPKLFVSKDKYLELCPKGEKTLFFKKVKVEFFAECKQEDGLVKRVTIYHDYKKLIINEVRSYYKCRQDKLILRRRFPYEFKTIEHYDPSEKFNYWKKMIKVDDHYRKIYFYHHRNKDGLIYREEQIGKKIFERYKGREDRLIYRSVTFDPDTPFNDSQHLYIEDKVYQRKLVIKKMAQKFELDPNKAASEQIRKTVFNMDKHLLIYYHYQEGQIFKQPDKISRNDLLSHNKMGEMNEKEIEKDNEDSKKKQYYKKINDMEQICHSQIKFQEEQAFKERELRKDIELNIQQYRL